MRAHQFLTISLLSLGFSGCVTQAIHQAQRQEKLKQAEIGIENYCEANGYRRGTQLGLQCRVTLAQAVMQHDAANEAAWQQADQARRAALLNAGVGLMTQPQPSYRMRTCSTLPMGHGTSTTCY